MGASQMKLSATLRNQVQASQFYEKAAHESKGWLVAGGGDLHVSIRPITRSIAQNSRMWAMLADIADQVVWHGRKLSSEDWKHVLSASLKKQDVVPGIDNTGFVVLGLSTSKMTIREMSDLMELAEAFGAQQGVKFKAPDSWKGMENG